MFSTIQIVLVLSLVINLHSIAQDRDASWFPSDTLTPAGHFINYVRASRDSYSVHWRNSRVHRSLVLHMDGAPNHFAFYKAETNRFIILEYGCGIPCKCAVFLPLDSVKAAFQIEMPEAYDLDNNLVAYNGDRDTIVWVENFLTRQKVPILGHNCGSAFNGYCVDSISVKNRDLYVHYLTQYDFSKPDDKKHWATIKKHIDL